MEIYYITGIDIKCTQKVFNDIVNKEKNSISSTCSLDVDVRQVSSRRGNNMYKIVFETLDDKSDQSSVEIVCNRNTTNGDMEFTPLFVKNYEKGFYKDDIGSISDYNAIIPMIQILENIAKITKGDFSYIVYKDVSDSLNSYSVVQGKFVNSFVGSVTKDGKAFSNRNGIKIDTNVDNSYDDDEDNMNLDFETLLSDWVKDNPGIKAKMKEQVEDVDESGNTITRNPTLEEKMDIVGKELVTQRMSDILTANEFRDLFIQVGLFGMQDSTLTTIYKLLA